MKDYWKNHYDANAELHADSPLRQVDRTINGAEMGESLMRLTVDAVRQALALRASDRVVDLCCGNGIVTREIATDVKSVVGVDFSAKLIMHACTSGAAPNTRYVQADVAALEPSFFAAADKVYMRDSVSCLNSESLLQVLRTLAQSPGVRAIFIAGIPDAAKLSLYYDDERKMNYYRAREAAGKPHIGTWWTRRQMLELVAQAGLSARLMAQDPALASAYYRYDCIIEK